MAKFCSNCGSPLAEGAGFCAECGAKTVDSVTQQTVQNQNELPIQQYAQSHQPDVPQSVYPHMQNTYQGVPNGYGVFVPNVSLPKNEMTSKAHRKAFSKNYKECVVSIVFSTIIYIISMIVIFSFNYYDFYYEYIDLYNSKVWPIIISVVLLICGFVNYFIALSIRLKAQQTRTQLRHATGHLINAVEFIGLSVVVISIYLLIVANRVPNYEIESIWNIVPHLSCLVISFLVSVMIRVDHSRFRDNESYNRVSKEISKKEKERRSH